MCDGNILVRCNLAAGLRWLASHGTPTVCVDGGPCGLLLAKHDILDNVALEDKCSFSREFYVIGVPAL